MNAATVILAALVSAVAGSVVLAGGMSLLVRGGHFTAATRHKLWFATLLAVAALPFVSAGVSVLRAQHTPSVFASEPVQQKNAGAETSTTRVSPEVAAPAVRHRLASAAAAVEPAPVKPSLSPVPQFDVGALRSNVALALDAALGVGALAGLAMLALSVFGLRLLKGRSIPLDDTLADDLPWLSAPGAGRETYLRLSHEIEVPVAIGFRRPVILIPVDLATHSGLRAIEDLVVHEHAHLRHYDDWTNLVQRAIERLFWFNPVVWYVGRRIGLEREMAADDAVVARSSDAVRYAESLLRMARQMRMPAYAVVAPGALFTRRQISTRIEALLEPGRERLMGLNPMTLAAGLALALVSSTLVAAAAPPLQLPPSVQMAQAAEALARAEVAMHAAAAQAAAAARSADREASARAAYRAAVAKEAEAAAELRRGAHALLDGRHAMRVAQPSAAVTVPGTHVHVPATHVHVPAVDVHVPETNFDIPGIEIQTPVVKVQLKALQDQLSQVQAQVPLPPLHLNLPPVQIAQGEIAQNDPLTREIVSRCMGCNLAGRDLRNLDLHGVILSGADLSRADLRGTNLSGATLTGVDLSHANLDGADLTNARLTGADIQGASFSGARLDGVQMTGTSFKGAGFDAAALRAILVHPCNGCDLSHMNLHGIDWHGLSLSGVDLSHADLTDANLNGIRLTGVDLNHAKLDGADLRNAVLIGCDFEHASLNGTRLEGISLTGTTLSP